MNTSLTCSDFEELLASSGIDVVCPSNPSYDTDRVIANLRFNYKPLAIAYCSDAEQVSICLKTCTSNNLGFKVRSGGHQHEGMCSANGTVIIDLSRIQKKLEPDPGDEVIEIGAGKPLAEVYDQLGERGFIIPGGGCGSVYIGGLTTGGGWGMSARKLGMTCDNVYAARMVLPSGEIKVVDLDNDPDLFWAIRGGGGGNFGIITHYLFKLTPTNNQLIDLSYLWHKADMPIVIKRWGEVLHELDYNLTTFCRITVVDNDHEKNPSLLLFGQYYGSQEQAEAAFKKILDFVPPPYKQTIAPVTHHQSHLLCNGQNPGLEKHSAKFDHGAFALQLGGIKLKPTEKGIDIPTTCGEKKYPHKVSSCFPINEYSSELLDQIAAFALSSKEFDNANTYLSLHQMGGVINDVPSNATAFPHRDKQFMLQFQAWWEHVEDPQGSAYMKWISDFREFLRPYTEGSFINFPDVDLVQPLDSHAARIHLLTYYYGEENLRRLIEIKGTRDPENYFNFGMSIPLYY